MEPCSCKFYEQPEISCECGKNECIECDPKNKIILTCGRCFLRRRVQRKKFRSAVSVARQLNNF